jgi:rhamnogalacturonan acetylesterase
MKPAKSFVSYGLVLMAVLVVSFAFSPPAKRKPTVFLIGDSTMKNGKRTGENTVWGWGSFLANSFDTTRIRVENAAVVGTSSRTF